MFRRIEIWLVFVLVGAAFCSQAGEHHVAQDSTGGFTSIQDAIDAANKWDIVTIHPGTYYENVQLQDRSVTLRSTQPDDWEVVRATVIDGSLDAPVITVLEGQGASFRISGLTLTNGLQPGQGGAGIHVGIDRIAGLTILNCLIMANEVDGDGGAIAFCDGMIQGCLITGNQCTGLYGCDGVIDSCVVTGNSPAGISHCDGLIAVCEIMENTGPGLSLCDGVIDGCFIHDNSASEAGGGLLDCGARIAHTVIEGNVALSGGGSSVGGGLFGCNGSIHNCLIVGNQSEGEGSALYECDALLSNCTIAGNTDTLGLPAVSMGGILRDCIVWGNTSSAAQLGAGTRAEFSCIQNWALGGEGNLDADPLFVTGRLGDFYLSQIAAGQHEDSPCLDAGSKSASAADLTDRTTRTDDVWDKGAVDLGYHYSRDEWPFGISLSCSVNGKRFAPGDVLSGCMNVENRGVDVAVDVFAQILTPTSERLSITQSGFAHGDQPWFSGIVLRKGFSFGPASVFELVVPPDAPPGRYTFSTEISRTAPDSFFVVPEDEVSFLVFPSAKAEYYISAEDGDDNNDGFEGTPWKTITHALDAIEARDTHPAVIHIAPGNYSASTNGETFPLNMKSWISLSGDDRDTVIVDAEESACHVIECESAQQLTIAGLTIAGGDTDLCDEPYRSGGGVHCINSSITLENNLIERNSNCAVYCFECDWMLIRNNVIKDNYGPVYLRESAFPEITGNAIIDNTGSGIRCYASSPLIADNTIAGNTGSGAGGGIFCEELSAPLITRNVIDGNSVRSNGGGIYSVADSSPTVENNLISNNTAGLYGDGGGIACWDYMMITHNRISDNFAGDSGGGIFSGSDSNPTIVNNLITDNSAGNNGGAMTFHYSTPWIRNNTVVGNTCSGYVGGIHFWDSWPTITDCILWGNGDDIGGGTNSYCCIEDGDPGEGNISADPLFVIGPLGDYYLDPDSPCIDAGSQSAEDAGLSDRTTQADGTPDTGWIDMGYHYPRP
ncbi:MAG: right-handed parallel beta-helix repeat-containing protein [Candidatus Coatesbacteria bacterium]|nr:right-handed parallel beta-helix repeat-containing protein [Candidatus Coatesbacteria bacterium]